MKTLSRYICEGSNRTPILTHFNDAQMKMIRKNLQKATMTIEGKYVQFRNIKFFVKDGYNQVYMEYFNSMEGRNASWHKYERQVCIGAKYISMGDFTLYTDTRGYRTADDCTLIEISYKGGKTKLVYYMDNSVHNIGSLYDTTITLEIPGDLTNAGYDYSKFDCKGYDKFMKTYLPKRVEYHQQIDPEDILYWNSTIKDNKLYIEIELPTGKGYGSHHRRTEYNCTLKGPSYECDRKLYTNDDEAQIVRKFTGGIKAFMNDDFTKTPEKVIITVSQELD